MKKILFILFLFPAFAWSQCTNPDPYPYYPYQAGPTCYNSIGNTDNYAVFLQLDSILYNISGGALFVNTAGCPNPPNPYYPWDANCYSTIGNRDMYAIWYVCHLIDSIAAASGPTQAWRLVGNAGTVQGTNYLGTSDSVGLDVRTRATVRLSISPLGNIVTTQGAQSGGAPRALLINSGTLTSLATGVEDQSFTYQPGSSKQWVAGSFNNQREAVFGIPTYRATGATTITAAASLCVAGSPIASTNMTITYPLAFWVQGGNTRLTGTTFLGAPSNTAGALSFYNATNNNTLTINSGVTSATHSWTLPTAQGAALTFLQNDGSGVLSWAAVPSATVTAWGLSGNSGTTAATNFLGTTDATNFRIQANGIPRATFKSAGDIIIGNKNSTYITLDYANARVGILDSVPARIFVINGAGANNYPRLNTDPAHDIFWEFTTNGVTKGLIGHHATDDFMQASGPLTGNVLQTWGVSVEDVTFPCTVGKVGIGTSSPSATLDLVGSLQYTDGNQAAGFVLTSDASGNATWQDPANVFTTDSSTTAGDAATINSDAGFFTKDVTGNTFTLTNNRITNHSRILLTMEGGITVTGSAVSPTTIATGSAVISFYTVGVGLGAPASNQRVAFLIIN